MISRTFIDFGIDVRGAIGGEVRTVCPQCSASRRKSHIRCLAVNVGGGVWHCHHCQWSGGLGRDGGFRDARAIQRMRAQAAAERAARYCANAPKVAALWDTGVPIKHGDPVSTYLRRRGIALDIFPTDLRFTRRLPYFDCDGTKVAEFPAMLGAVRTLDGSLVAVHRTHLTVDGAKAPVDPVRKLSSAAGPVTGAAVRLAAERAGVLGVAEGLETALAASAASGLPVWSAISAGGLEGFRWPASVRRLIVFGDNDLSGVGQGAAEALATRARGAGLMVAVLIPSTAGRDWADEYATFAGEAAA